MSGSNDERARSGLVGRNKRRFSDAETERRMLRTAMEMVHSTGLTVSLDHISFEDVIRDAAVSRSAVYRRWPYKDLFFSDLLKELARAATPATIDDDGPAELARQAVLPHLDDGIRTPERRHALLTELLRQTAQHDFDAIHGSTLWRTYLACTRSSSASPTVSSATTSRPPWPSRNGHSSPASRHPANN